MNRRRIVYPMLVAGLALGVGWVEGRWHSDRTEAAKRTLARPTRPSPPPTGVEVPMTIGPTPAPAAPPPGTAMDAAGPPPPADPGAPARLEPSAGPEAPGSAR